MYKNFIRRFRWWWAWPAQSREVWGSIPASPGVYFLHLLLHFPPKTCTLVVDWLPQNCSSAWASVTCDAVETCHWPTDCWEMRSFTCVHLFFSSCVKRWYQESSSSVNSTWISSSVTLVCDMPAYTHTHIDTHTFFSDLTALWPHLPSCPSCLLILFVSTKWAAPLRCVSH